MTNGSTNPAASSPPVQTAASAVAEALAQMILGEMSPGQSMPSEGDLAERYGVSRLTVREAMKLLAGRGLVEVGRGRRATVVEPSGVAFSDFLSIVIRNDPKGLFDLIQFRMSLEVQSATLAARRITRAGLTALETAIEGMRVAAEDQRQGKDPVEAERLFHHHDVAFHGTIALSSGNRFVSYLFEAMAVPLQQSFRLSRAGHSSLGGTLEDTVAAHEAILNAIRDGNPKAAGAAMRTHLENTERDIYAALNADPRDLHRRG